MQFLFLIFLVVLGCLGGLLGGVFIDWLFSLPVLIFVIVHAIVDNWLTAYAEREAQKYPVRGASWQDWRVMEQVYAVKPWLRTASKFFWVDGFLHFVTYSYILFIVIGMLIRLFFTF